MRRIRNAIQRRAILSLHFLMHCLQDLPEWCQRLPLHLRIKLSNIRNMKFELHFLRYFANLILFVALCIGLFDRWHHTKDIIILVIAFIGLFIFLLACALTYYFSMEQFASSLVHLWFGCLLGVITFTQKPEYKKDTQENIMNVMFMTCLGLHCFWVLAERCVHTVNYAPMLLSKVEMIEMVGMAAAGFVGPDWVSIFLITIAMGFTMAAIRLKSLLGLINFAAMGIISIFWFFPSLNVHINVFSLTCFIGRLVFEPIVDLYYCSLSTLDRWSYVLQLSSLLRKLSILGIVSIEIAMYAVLAASMPNHKEWFIVVPLFIAFGFIWLSFHIVFIITCWQLSNKITECNATYLSISGEARSMHKIMASKGVRHFSLISRRLVQLTILSTLIVGALGWTTKTGVTISMVFIVLPIESSILSLLLELGSVLGGTCIGFAVVAPATYLRNDGSPTVLHTGAVNEIGTRSTDILNSIQRFFTQHMIDVFGCDYSSSGLTLDSLRSKLGLFFDRHTGDGPKYDTYIFYYSGHVARNGDLALSGKDSLNFESLLEWWQEKINSCGARLILILDTEFSYQWVKQVRKNDSAYVAIQTTKLEKKNANTPDPEDGSARLCIGDFTQDWVTFNSGGVGTSDIDWKDKSRRIKAMYGTSRIWSDFSFHLPTQDDITEHWETNFPKLTRPLIKFVNLVCGCRNFFCCCSCILNCLRRKKMSWCPPVVLDTGHAFKLVKS